jgi:uncharacterized protein (DUF2236 family)
MWMIMREMSVPFGSLSAVLLQVAHPAIAAAGRHSSCLETDLRGRITRTFSAIYQIIFGDLDTALETIDRLHSLHLKIRGSEREGRKETQYSATDPGLLFWVLATLIDSSVRVYELVVAPLSLQDRNDYFQDMKTFGVAMGIPPEYMPGNWPAFVRYFEAMLTGDRLRLGQAGHRLGRFIVKNPLARFTLAGIFLGGLLPERWRREYGLPWGGWEKLCFQRVVACVRFLLKRMPPSMRFCPAYHQAMLRTGCAPRESKTAGTRMITRFCEMLNLPFCLKDHREQFKGSSSLLAATR